MTFQLINHPATRAKRPKEPIPRVSESLLNHIRDYENCAEQLSAIADLVPNSLDEADHLDQAETRLHDRRAEIIGTVAGHRPASLEDVKALLRLWYIERVEEQSSGALNASDELVIKVCEFLDVA